jgi:predicted RNA binding protein YcfA (HicA-like mRNA interferase family)
MSKDLPALRAREVVRVLEKAGFVKWRQKVATSLFAEPRIAGP